MKSLSHVPNIITVSRIAFAPLLILVLKGHHFFGALAVFAIAGLSDGLDGYIAKRFSCASRLGAILDPAADKILLVSTYVMLAWLHMIPFWLVLVVAFRDLLIVGGYLVYTSIYGPVQMRPSYLSKINTFMQIWLVIFLLAERAFHFQVAHAERGLIFGVLFTTVVSGGHYLWAWGIVKNTEVSDGHRN